MTRTSMLRFFAVVLRAHVTLAAAAGLLLGMAAWMARNDPDEIGQLAILALFVQMFAAARGFREPARRGYFDPVLVRGYSRIAVAAAHWTVSVAPVLIVWTALSLVVLWIHPGERPVGLTLQGVVAIFYVSSAAWTLGLPFTRYASGVLWLLALFVLSGMNAIPALRMAFLAYPSGTTSLLQQAGAALICPVFLVANGRTPEAPALGVIVLATALLMGVGALFIATVDLPLQDPS